MQAVLIQNSLKLRIEGCLSCKGFPTTSQYSFSCSFSFFLIQNKGDKPGMQNIRNLHN